jgi:ABC-type branched-subunit amino acid transport system substrate-binding protein
MNKMYVLLSMVVLLLSAQDVDVQWNRMAEDYFLLGVRQYSQKDFKSALQSFHNSILSGTLNHRITASTMMMAKTQYALKHYEEAITLCDSFLVQFPGSLYREDAYFTRGMCYYNLSLYVQTIAEMESVLAIAQQPKNQEHAAKIIEHVASEFLSDGQIDSLLLAASTNRMKAQWKVIRAERYFSAGDHDRARDLLRNVDTTLLNHSLQRRMNLLRSRIERGNLVRIGVLLPLSSSKTADSREKKVALEVLEGIELALSEYEENISPGQVSIELQLRNSERRSDTIRSALLSFAEDDKIIALIGPIFSDETMAAAVASREVKIPLISPTATDDSIASVSDYIFLANTTGGMRGKILADYAVQELGAKNVAVLASDAPFSKTQADSFAAHIQRLGGTVLIDRRYTRGSVDLREHFKAMRKAAAEQSPEYIVQFKGKINTAEVLRTLLSFGIRAAIADSALAYSGELNVTTYLGARAKELVDSLKLPFKRQLPYVDSLNYPVTAIEVLFNPIYASQQIGVVSSQLAYYNVKTQLLGTSEWYNPHELEMNRRYADGVIFGSDRWIEQNENTKRVLAKYMQKYGRQASDYVLFGFDVMSMIIQLLNDGALTREEMITALLNARYSGIRNSISFTRRRVNGSLNILQYKEGSVTKLQTYILQE